MVDWENKAFARYMEQQAQQLKERLVIMMSHHQHNEQSESLTSQGFYVIPKPVTASILFDTLLKIHRPDLETQSTLGNEQHRLKDICILVTDDSEINRLVAHDLLKAEGAEVFTAENGSIALNLLEESPQPFDIVLMDIQMPVMDGLTATRLIRENPRFSQLPVIALTAGVYTEQKIEAQDAGVNAFLGKPFQPNQLIRVILDSLSNNLDENKALLDQTDNQANQNFPLIDKEFTLNVFRSQATLKKLLKEYINRYEPVIDTLNEMTSSDSLISLIHKLSGASGQLGLFKVAHQAKTIESRLRNQESCESEGDELKQILRDTINAVDVFIKDLAPEIAEDKNHKTQAVMLSLESLSRLLEILNTDDIDQIEPLLHPLLKSDNQGQLDAINQAINNFDFRLAEQLLTKLIDKLGDL